MGVRANIKATSSYTCHTHTHTHIRISFNALCEVCATLKFYFVREKQKKCIDYLRLIADLSDKLKNTTRWSLIQKYQTSFM